MSEGFVARHKQQGLINHARRYYRGKIQSKLLENGYDRHTLSRWENGIRTTPSHFGKICEVFNKHPDDFLSAGNDDSRFYWLEQYFSCQDSNQRRAATVGYLHVLQWLHTIEVPGTYSRFIIPPPPNRMGESVNLGFDVCLRLDLPNKRWAGVEARMLTEGIYLMMKSGDVEGEAGSPVISTYAGGCDCRMILRFLKRLSRIGVDKDVPPDKIHDNVDDSNFSRHY